MAMSIEVFHSSVTDPYQNLAIEDWLYRTLPTGYRRLFLYTNRPCVVLGRHQNPWIECDLEGMLCDGVDLVRRQSGGGTVYHDYGNLNFCFIAEKNSYSQEENFAIVLNALQDMGIRGERSGRNDILVDGRKVSGSAFKVGKTVSFHHGTLLIESDLDLLMAYLSAAEQKLESKGIASVRSVVANLQECNPQVNKEVMQDALSRTFREFYGCKLTDSSDTLIAAEILDQDPQAAEFVSSLQNWDWLYGKTPDFSLRLFAQQSKKEFVVQVHRARIQEVSVAEDTSTSPSNLVEDEKTTARLTAALKGLEFTNAQDLLRQIDSVRMEVST